MKRVLCVLALGACAQPDFESSFVPHPLRENPCAARLEVNPNDGSYAAGGLFCNQDEYGGGWLLAAKVFRVRNAGSYRNEPQNFWRQAFNANTMNSMAIPDNEDEGIASHDIRTLPVSQATTLWVELVHANANDPTAPKSWFKRIDNPSALTTWFGTAGPQTATDICTDPQMTDCPLSGKITINPLTGRLRFHNMMIEGSYGDYGLYMDLNLGHADPQYNAGVCSDTAAGPGPPDDWPDNLLNDLEWGHGMRIWIR